jgi:hypothetical protein
MFAENELKKKELKRLIINEYYNELCVNVKVYFYNVE